MLEAPVQITDKQREQYIEEGYFILESVVPDEHLRLLRDECQGFIDRENAEMDRRGVDCIGINHRNSRYFINLRYKQGRRLHEYIFSDLMAEICRATIGDTAFLFYDQWVIKCAEQGMKFGWHQDSGYVDHECAPYVSCWCALDDVSEENGTVYVLPYSRAGTKRRVEHVREEGSNDLIGYHGSDPGIPVIAPAGSIAVFSGTTFHRSGANTTFNPRRAYLTQYSPVPILVRDGSRPFGWAEPFLKNGVRVR
ncbi:MAG TPA: phytanoyl-CoA dioxygenase family protein [Planctomycetota bacterium]|nr:phytanoyl-CoA dioxygenase family protein [Planctomycetota bacterium]